MKRKISKKKLIRGYFINNRKIARNLAKLNMKKSGIRNITKIVEVKDKNEKETYRSFFSRNWRKFSFEV